MLRTTTTVVIPLVLAGVLLSACSTIGDKIDTSLATATESLKTTRSTTYQTFLLNKSGAGSDVKRQLNTDLQEQFVRSLSYCRQRFAKDEYDISHLKVQKNQSSTWGALSVLIGSVAAYTPAKVVLTGFGASSTSGGSLVAPWTETFTDDSTRKVTELQERKASLWKLQSLYGVGDYAQDKDPDGDKRLWLINQLPFVCDGTLAQPANGDAAAAANSAAVAASAAVSAASAAEKAASAVMASPAGQ